MPDGEIKRVLALGFFDGVHVGHAALLNKTRKLAEQIGARPSVLSFDIHPDTLVKGEEVSLINSAAGRADLISRLFGIDSVIFIHFNEDMMRMPWDSFAESIIHELNCVHIIAGHDFRFGHNGEGNTEKLTRKCVDLGIGCDIIPKVEMESLVVSSTYIRKLISDGEIERANMFLGHAHVLVDTVRYGYRLGRSIGAPTINMRFPEGVLIPKHGVYASKVVLEDGEHLAVTNIGVRPTVSGAEEVSVESFILDFNGNLYGRQVRVEFYSFLRPEMRFSDINELKEQIERDANSTRKFFGGC